MADTFTQLGIKAGLLTSQGAGYYDLRGRLALPTGRLVIDAEVEPVMERTERSSALGGKAGLEVATALLMAATGVPCSLRMMRS